MFGLTPPLPHLRWYVGDQGSGKTLNLVYDAMRALAKRPWLDAFGNIDVDMPRYRRVEMAELLDPDGPPGLRLLDEGAASLESRRSMQLPLSWLNESRQLRKGGHPLWGTVQEFGMVDARFRSQTREVVRVRSFLKLPERRNDEGELVAGGHPLLFQLTFWPGGNRGVKMKPEDKISGRGGMRSWRQLRHAARAYDTYEKVALAGHLQASKDFYRDSAGGGTERRSA